MQEPDGSDNVRLERTVRRLPERFVDEGLKLAEGSCIFGVPFSELSKEELIATAAQGWKAEQRAREEGSKRLEFAFDMNRALRRA